MFEQPRKKTVNHARLRGLTPVIPASQLILNNKRPDQIKTLATACQLSPARFKALCGTLFSTVLNHTQQLTDTTNGYFSSPGGAFDHALSRTCAASDLFRSFLLQAPDAKLTEIQQCWWYALFSAGLLRGIGKLPLDYVVKLYDQQGHLIKTWEPLLEPLANTAYAYHAETINHSYDESFRQRLNIVLAQQLMPKEGFAWLTKHLDIFEVWLALLHEDSASSHALSLILDRADAIAIQEDLLDLPLELQHPKHSGSRAHSFIDAPDDSLSDREQRMGVEFIKFLFAKLKSGELTFNQHPLLSVAGGTLIGPDAFKLFVRESAMFKNWIAVRQAVMSLGLHDTTPGAADNKSVLIKGSIALPETVHYQAAKTAAAKETNVIDAINPGIRKQLSADGQWQLVETQKPVTLTLKPHD
ncbi:MAG: TraI domain-containing protein [Legionella sp.]|nr:TraI domain-containing protein [Legionella sp.]